MAAPQGLLKIFQSKENSHLKISIQYLGHHFKRLRFRTALGLLRLLKIIPNITVCSTWLYHNYGFTSSHFNAINEASMARKAKTKTAIIADNTR